jgi:hypothetical protein
MENRMAKKQSDGRERNDALPPGERPGLVSEAGIQRTGEKSRRQAGPDGPDAGRIGETFKSPPGKHLPGKR